MDIKLPEVEARELLLIYNGFNNQILEWKRRLTETKNFNISRSQAEYILKYHEIVPKVAKKHITVTDGFSEKIMEDNRLTFSPTKIWCEKLLVETDKAFHIWGKYHDLSPNQLIWLPKSAIIFEKKKLKYDVDYSEYDKVRPPFPHQKVAIETLLANDKFILADDMGLAKTGSSIIASLESGVKKVLIICPASLKINWKREIEIYSQKKVLIVEGRKWGSTFDYYIINYDILKNYHTTDKNKSEGFNLIEKEKFDLVIIDEAHNLCNSQAQRTKLVNDIVKGIPKIWLLTGTPMTSRPINYFNLLKMVDSPLSDNWQHYVKRYCRGFQITIGRYEDGSPKKIWKTDGASNLDELRKRTESHVLRRLKNDILDLPEKIITPVFLELTSTDYNEELENFIRISKENKNSDTIAVSINRLMPIRQILSIEKIPITCELIDKFLELDKKVIVFTNFTNTLDLLHEHYKKKSVTLDGRMSKEKRQLSVDKFQNDPKVKVFISNMKAGGVGITLTEAEGVIVNDMSFVPSDHSQAEDRAYRIGQKNSVLVYYPLFENTIEKIIYNIIQRKKNIIDRVMGDGDYEDSFAEELFKHLF